MGISRDLELRIRGHLREIEQANDEVIGDRQGLWPAVDGYRQTLESVAECGTVDEVDDIAEHIKDRIVTHEMRPANRKVRRYARKVVSRAGYPADDFLNTA